MKKFLALLLVLVMCVGVLAGCKKDNGDDTGPTLEQAKDYLYNIMKEYNGIARSNDYDVVGKVIIDGTAFEVTWTTDNENITVKPSTKANLWTIDLPEVNETEVTYNLTATIKAADGSTTTVTFTPVFPAIDLTSPQAGVAYKLQVAQNNIGKTLYFNGLTESETVTYRLALTEKASEAVDVFVEVNNGQYKLYFMKGDVKTYIVVAEYQDNDNDPGYGKGTLTFETSTDLYYTFNEEAGTLIHTDADNEDSYYLGTYSTYTTISVSNASYITGNKASSVDVSQFPARLVVLDNINPDTPVDPPAEDCEHNYVNGVCTECGEEDPDYVPDVPNPPASGNIVFDFGANGTSGTHQDGNDIGTTKSYTSGDYTLTFTDAYKAYAGGFDKAGNSILKLGTSSVAGTVTFVVPDDVTSVIIHAARYKNYADNNIIVINGTSYTLTMNSDDGQYEAITVDTTTSKTVTIASSTDSKPRCVVNTIEFVIGEGGSETPVDPPAEDCTHNYVDGVCTECGEEDPDYVAPNPPATTTYPVVSTLNNGDKVVIGAPAYNKLLSMIKTGNYNVGVNYTVDNFANVTNDEIFVVTVNDDGSYTFTSVSGKVLAMQDQYTSLNDTGANNKWTLTVKSEGIFLVMNTVRNTYLEWYNQYGNWSTYSNASDSQFEISFYLVEAGEGGSETPVDPPAEDCEHNYVDGVCTECGEEDPDYVAPNPPTPAAGGSADFDSIVLPNNKQNGDSSYTATYTTTNGWVTANSAIQCGGASDSNPQFVVIGSTNADKAVCLNGKTSAPGKVTSPTLAGGISKLTLTYTKMFTDTELSVTITITDVATGTTYTHVVEKTADKDDKYSVWTDEWELETPLTGEFTIEIVNNCPTNQDGNKDRFTILDLSWEA